MSEPVVTMKQLLEARVHFGHQTRRWNPKMKRFIFGDRNGIYIIDLQQTLKRLEVAYTFVRDTVADGGTVLFVGTKKQAQDPIQSYAEKCGMPYINERWLGGMLTNFETMSKRVAKMAEYRRMRASGEFEAMPKKEALLISRELTKLERNLGGIAAMEKLPSIVFVLDTKEEHIAVTEANKLKIPLVAVVDTNCDPDIIQYVIPGNDDAIRSGALMCRVIADAVEEGRLMASKRPGATPPPRQRSAAEEAEIASQQADARRQAAEAAAAREARIAAQQAAPQPDPESQTTEATPSEDAAGPDQSTGEAGPASEPTNEASAPSDGVASDDGSGAPDASDTATESHAEIAPESAGPAVVPVDDAAAELAGRPDNAPGTPAPAGGNQAPAGTTDVPGATGEEQTHSA